MGRWSQARRKATCGPGSESLCPVVSEVTCSQTAPGGPIQVSWASGADPALGFRMRLYEAIVTPGTEVDVQDSDTGADREMDTEFIPPDAEVIYIATISALPDDSGFECDPVQSPPFESI